MTNLMQKARKATVAALLLCLICGVAGAEEPWRQSFDETCSRTTQAMTLSVKELTALLEKCDALQKVIETQEESVRKVYLKRLQLCRNLYAYVLDYKKTSESTQN